MLDSKMDTVEKIQDSSQTGAIFKKRGKPKYRKKALNPSPPSSSSSSSSESDDYNGSETESGHEIKRRKKNPAILSVSSKSNAISTADIQPTTFSADRTTAIKSSNDATKSSNWYDESTIDSLSAKNLLGTTRASTIDQIDGTYKGLANSPNFIAKNPSAPKRVVGPIKAPTNLRTITVTDYAPDVCKDYKQTGFCGFGDSCKYLHAREDYKHGWQLDKEWENVTKGKKLIGGTKLASANRNAGGEESEDDDSILEGIPFACIICKENYKNPIVTKCRHYFCETCALKRYKKYPSCAACGAATGGVFNVAKSLTKLLDRKRERARKNRVKAIEAGEQVSDEDTEL